MRRSLPLALILLVATPSCRSSKTTTSAADTAATRAARTSERAAERLEGELLAWLTVGDPEGTLAALIGPAGSAARVDIFQSLGIGPAVAETIDTRRPLVIAALDPRQHTARGRAPFLVQAAITSREAFRAALAAGRPELPAKKGTLIFGAGEERLYVTFAKRPTGEVANIVFDEAVLDGAPALLDRLAATAARNVFSAHVSIDKMAGCCADTLAAITGGLVMFTTPRGSDGAYAIYGLRHARRSLELLPEADEVELRVEPGPTATRIVLRASAAPGTPFAGHALAQRTGPVYSAELVPRDAMLVHATHLAPAETGAEADALSAYLAEVAGTPAQAPRWRDAIAQLYPLLGGEIVYAVWPAIGGGIGAGGAFRVTDGEKARAALGRVYEATGKAMGAAVAHQVGLDPSEFRFTASWRPGGATVAGRRVDLLQLRPRFPSSKKKAAREKQVVKWLFGDTLTLAFAAERDRVVWTAGRDWRPRLEAMLTRGVQPITAKPAFAAAAADQRVSLSFVPTGALARFVVEALAATSSDQTQAEVLAPFAADDEAALVSGTRVTRSGENVVYEIDTSLPSAVLADLAGVGGAIWRVSMAPILGAPATPPLPAPPPTITPPASSGPPPGPSPQREPAAPELPAGRGA